MRSRAFASFSGLALPVAPERSAFGGRELFRGINVETTTRIGDRITRYLNGNPDVRGKATKLFTLTGDSVMHYTFRDGFHEPESPPALRGIPPTIKTPMVY